MANRNLKIERKVLECYQSLPKELLHFPLELQGVISYIPNCKIHSYQSFAEKYSVSEDEVIAFCESDTGCTHKENNNYIIMFNNSVDIPMARRRFTIAHELGHIALGHFDLLNNQSIAENHFENKIEYEANYFASCLLCPMPVVCYYRPNHERAISRRFFLSNEASAIALENYRDYDRSRHMSWHNDIIKLFNLPVKPRNAF